MSDSPTISYHDLEEIIYQICPVARGHNIVLNVNFFNSGILDSISAIQLAQSIEGKYGFTFKFKDIRNENFTNLNTILTLLKNSYGFECFYPEEVDIP